MIRKIFFIFTIVLSLSITNCDEPTSVKDEPTRWVSITGLDSIGLSSFKFSVLLTDIEGKGITIGVVYEMPENAFPEGIPNDVVIECPLIVSIDSLKNEFGFEYKYWHGNGDYYVNFFVMTGRENVTSQKWKSNDILHFSDDSPRPLLSLHDAHLIIDE